METSQPANDLAAILDDGDVVLGILDNTYSPTLVEFYGELDLDFVWLDLEHGGPDPGDWSQLEDLLRAAERTDIELLVRLPDTDPTLVRKALDLGVRNVFLPRVKTADEVRDAGVPIAGLGFGMDDVDEKATNGCQMLNLGLLLGAFALFLGGAEIFTNSVEWLGHHLGVSESATGSILAAVRTALPETMIPVIAIVSVTIAGAHLFVTEVEFFSSEVLDVPAALVALLLAPLATELPEKFNSGIWISEGTDILAIGNITGAMVFQGTLPVTLGILFTT